MANPKKWDDKPECGVNVYESKAVGKAELLTGWSWKYRGAKAAAPAIPPFPAAAPPAGAALAKLRADAETSATNLANALMDVIAKYNCPGECKRKTDIDKTLIDTAAWTGQPRLINSVKDEEWMVGVIANVDLERSQFWVQDAEQEFKVIYTCRRPGE